MKWTNNPMFDLSPSYLEVLAAKSVFLKELRKNLMFAQRVPESAMSPEVAVSNALAEVWRQARIYSRDRDTAALQELAGVGKGAMV